MFLLVRIAWRNLWRYKRRTLITAGAMAIGLAFCMAMLALVDGIYTDLFEMAVTENTGHAQVHNPNYPKKRAMWETVDDAETLVKQFEARPEVHRVSSRLFGYALLGFDDKANGAQLIGIEPGREDAMTHIIDKVAEGRFIGDTAEGEIVLGLGLADKLNAGLGDVIVAVTQAADGSTGNDLYTVVGIIESGSVILDRSGAWVHLANLQELLVLEGQVHEIALITSGREEVDGMVAACLNDAEARGLQLRSWRDVNPQMAQMMDMADASGVIILFFIFGVAALGILNTMLMSVFERTKELGVIRALGLRPLQLVKLVMWETFALAAVACLVGVPAGLGLDAYLVLHGLDLSGVMEGYSIMGSNIEPIWIGEFNIGKVIQTVVGLFVISFFAAIWPAIRAARLNPVEAMRQE